MVRAARFRSAAVQKGEAGPEKLHHSTLSPGRSTVRRSPSLFQNETFFHSRAFTLIELLVVVAIIAILAGIALTAYGAAMEKAHAVKCLANLKNIGQGVSLYLNDNDDDFFSKVGRERQALARTSEGQIQYQL
jgi:prepilin-type N-terminal cleavage/methylation domain-containing protein